jgi:hypothetical protein
LRPSRIGIFEASLALTDWAWARNATTARISEADMALRLLSVALALSTAASAVYAQTVDLVIGGQPIRATARLATQGIGYSVVRQPIGVEPRSYRVLLVCTVDGRNATANCPAPAHLAYCPYGIIVCQ